MRFQKSGFRIIFLLLVFLAVSCGRKPEKEKQNNVASGEEVNSGITETSRDTLALNLKNGFVSGAVHKEERDKKYFVFQTDGPAKLSAKLVSQDTTANIRFTQIFFPDGSADGPFGRELKYDLEQAGTHTLSVGENMMAGNPWSGDFTIEVKLDQ
ncbi:hypothetical protein LS482_08990 [Sinomicrobium kalidii]|uniref:hypothetical protein n=1 Tax=Sinomicrobium kalidii TaxID=2900738 RepID=UPI001E5752D5|nr:hypothetical protein [Sinomicrobium kalidii]UGU18003.1 hypothetical protein LS482_08990 [Sinomicrobium kalidii]